MYPGEVGDVNTIACISNSVNTKVDSQSMGTCKQYYTKIFYRKDVNPGHIKSLLVRPLQHSLAVFKNNAGAGRSKVKTGNQTIRVRNSRLGKSDTDAGNQSASMSRHKETDDQPTMHTTTFVQLSETANQSASELNAGEGSCLHASRTDLCRSAAGADCLQNRKVQVHQDTTFNVNDKVNIANKVAMEVGNPDIDTKPHCDSIITPSNVEEDRLLYDVNAYKDDKFMSSIIYVDTYKPDREMGEGPTYTLCKQQSSHNFGFIPLTEPILPGNVDISPMNIQCPIELHKKVKLGNKPNFLGARIPVPSQLNVNQWKHYLVDYWDKQLLEFLQFGFPLGFNRQCTLKSDSNNHKSAVEYQKILIHISLKKDSLEP